MVEGGGALLGLTHLGDGFLGDHRRRERVVVPTKDIRKNPRRNAALGVPVPLRAADVPDLKEDVVLATGDGEDVDEMRVVTTNDLDGHRSDRQERDVFHGLFPFGFGVEGLGHAVGDGVEGERHEGIDADEQYCFHFLGFGVCFRRNIVRQIHASDLFHSGT